MSCKSLRTKLELYAGDDLDGRESVAVVAHLRTCLACYREYVELRDMLTAVRASGRPRARGDAEVESLVAGVMREIHGPPPPAPRLVERLTTVASVSGWAAALLLAFTLGWQVLSERTRVPSAPVGPRTEPRIIDHGDNMGGVTPASSPFADLEAEFARQLDELRRKGGTIRVPPTRVRDNTAPASPKKKNF